MDDRINVNTAGETELTKAIGEVLAVRTLANRRRHEAFMNIKEFADRIGAPLREEEFRTIFKVRDDGQEGYTLP
jgi:hypothetical protein